MTHRIRTLNLAYTLPHPARNGYDLRALNLMNRLAPHLDQTLFCRTIEPLTDDQQQFCDQASFKTQVLHFPRPTWWQKLTKGLRFLFSRYPIMAGGWYFPEMAKALEATLASEPFDFVVLEGIWMCVYWPIIKASGVRVVLNLYDLEAGALARQASVLPLGFKRFLYQNGAKRMATLEQKLPEETAITWAVSEKERQILLQHNPDLPALLAPGGVNSDSIELLPLKPGKQILFVGSLQYLPNVGCVQFFVKEVMPRILKQIPDAVFRVVGRRPDERVTSLHNPPSIDITGEVDDLTPCYDACQVCVVPLLSGGGTRLKILEAMAYGRPVVSTSIGAEGIDVTHEQDILIADTPEELAAATCRVLTESGLAERLTTNGRRLVDQKYMWKNIAETMHQHYATLTDS